MRKHASILALFFLFALPVSAQKVGLVLSGGGAKGLYHIGVIKALEENNIPIDYISGTSMGAIVGAMYASGLTPDEMIAQATSPQIGYWMTGKVEDRYLYYFKQMYPSSSLLSFRLNTGPKKRSDLVPGNLVPSEQIDMAFVDYFTPASVVAQGDFDSLYIPFRCVGTDAVNRREVIFSKGDLGKAVRISMSIPLVFSPIRADSTVYYDGGIYNNFPWQILQEDFHPGVLIGSKCVEGNRDPEKNSMIDQAFALTMFHTDYNLPEGSGVMIDRVFSDVSMLDFNKSQYLIECGYKDAMERMDSIKHYVTSRIDPEQRAARRAQFRQKLPELMIEKYTISGLSDKQAQYVSKLLSLNRSDKPFSFDLFRTRYFKLLSEGEISGSYPELVYNPQSGMFTLNMKMQTKPNLKLNIGGNISSTALTQIFLGIDYRTISRSANSYALEGCFSPFYSSTLVRGRNDFFIRAPFYVEYGITYNYYNYFRSNYGMVSRQSDLSFAKYSDGYAHAAFGLPLNRHSVFHVTSHAGIDSYRYYQQPGFGDGDTLDRTRFEFYGARAEMRSHTANYQLYPTRGVSQSLSGILVEGRETFLPGTTGKLLGQPRQGAERFWVGAKYFRRQFFDLPDVKWLSLGYLIDAVWTNHPDFLTEYATNISSPAFTPTPHSKSVYLKEFRSKTYLAGGLLVNFEFNPKFYLQLSSYSFLPDNYDQVQEDIRQRVRFIYDASLVYQTVLGPASVSLSKYDRTRHSNWFITLNFGIPIFNGKGLFY